jgi:hypothetical protein
VVVLVCAAAGPAVAAPDEWVRWTNVPDADPGRYERGAWVRSLDFVGGELFVGSEGDGAFSSLGVAGPWSAVSGGLDTVAKKDVRQIASAGGRLYAATTGGLLRAFPGGSWEPVGQGLGPLQAIHFTTSGEADIVVGTVSSGIWYSSDSGGTWTPAAGLAPGESVFQITAGAGALYAAAASGVYVSADQGRSWILASDGIPPSEAVLRLAVVPGLPQNLYASTSGGVYRSTNAGVTWEAAAGSGDSTLGNDHARALVLAPASFGAGRLVAGTDTGAWATRDSGVSWGRMSPDTLVDPDPSDPAPDPLPFGQQSVWSLGIGFGANLLAGTQTSGVYSLLFEQLANTTNPAITPTSGLNEGERLTAGDGTWTGTRPTFFTYQWQRCDSGGGSCVAIAGAVAKTYTLTTADVGGKVRVLVRGRNLVPPDPSDELSTPVPASGTVAPEPATAPFPRPGEAPTISPPTSANYSWGQTLTVNNGGWRTTNNAAITVDSFRYQWKRCDGNGNNCTDIPGTDEQSYTSTPADIGGEIAGYVTATEAGASSSTRLAGKTFDILEKTPVNLEQPRIVGESYLGRVLSSSAGAWMANHPTYERRWLRCEADGTGCTPIIGQTGRAYALAAEDRGKRLQLEVTAAVADPNQQRRTIAYSAQTAAISDPPAGITGAPGAIAGPPAGTRVGTTARKPVVKIKRPRKLKVGARLSVPATIAGFRKITYQWRRGGKKIKKATKRVYKLVRRDLGKRISCRLRLIPTGGGSVVVVTTRAVSVPKARHAGRTSKLSPP